MIYFWKINVDRNLYAFRNYWEPRLWIKHYIEPSLWRIVTKIRVRIIFLYTPKPFCVCVPHHGGNTLYKAIGLDRDLSSDKNGGWYEFTDKVLVNNQLSGELVTYAGLKWPKQQFTLICKTIWQAGTLFFSLRWHSCYQSGLDALWAVNVVPTHVGLFH